MSINTIAIIASRQDAAKYLLLTERVPVVGAVASVPGILMTLVLSVSNTVQALFKSIQAKCDKSEKADSIRLQANQKFGNAADWAILFFNQIANLFTLGILNNIFVSIVLRRLHNAHVDL